MAEAGISRAGQEVKKVNIEEAERCAQGVAECPATSLGRIPTITLMSELHELRRQLAAMQEAHRITLERLASAETKLTKLTEKANRVLEWEPVYDDCMSHHQDDSQCQSDIGDAWRERLAELKATIPTPSAPSPAAEIKHQVAGMVGLVQCCTDCGAVISDYRGAMIQDGHKPVGFAAGPVYIIGNRASEYPDSPYFKLCLEAGAKPS